MRIAGSVLTLICGIVVLVGVFMTWFSGTSGWDIIDVKMLGAIGFHPVWQHLDFYQPLMVLIAGIAVIVFALPSFIVSVVTRGGKAAVVTLSALASVASVVALGGAVWFIIDILIDVGPFFNMNGLDIIDYGIFISAVAALVGMICAFVTMSAAISAKPRPRVARPTPAPAAVPVVAPPPPPPAPVVTMSAAPVVTPPLPPAPVAATPPPPPPPPPPPAPKPAVDKVKAEPAVEKSKKAPAAQKPEGIDESTLPMVQQPWETPEEFRARRKRRTVQF